MLYRALIGGAEFALVGFSRGFTHSREAVCCTDTSIVYQELAMAYVHNGDPQGSGYFSQLGAQIVSIQVKGYGVIGHSLLLLVVSALLPASVVCNAFKGSAEFAQGDC
jgi:hypothetical protein